MQFFFIYLNIIVTSIAILVGIYKYSTLNIALRVLLLVLLVSLVTDVSSLVMNINGINNLWLINIYAMLEGVLLLSVFLFLMPKSKFRNAIPFIAFLYLSAGVLEWVFWIENFKLLTATILLEAFLMLVFSLFTFYEMVQKLEYEKLQHNPIFWFNTGVLLYFAGGLFVSAFSNYILKLPEIGLWMIHNVLHFFYFCSFTIAFWKTTTK